jgi:outer membrane protein OmpA-like peptidoglycan-associated protein
MTGSCLISRAARCGCLLGAAVLAVSACGAGGGGNGPAAGSTSVAQSRDCGLVSKVPLPGPSHPTTVLVVDNTSSGPASTLPSTVAAMLQRAQAAQGQLVILGVNGAGGNPLLVKDVALDPEPGHTSREADAARAIAIACVPQWTASKAAAPTRPGSDILGAVNAAIRRAPAQIIVMSDGLDNVDPLDLNKIGYGMDPRSVAALLSATHSIDHAGSSTPVLWADLGVTVKPVPGAVRASLKLMWAEILRRAGTSVTFLPDETQAGTRRPGAPADVVRLPAVSTTSSGCHTSITVPTDLLFQPGDAHLQAGTSLLDGVRDDMLSQPRSTAVIGGHTAAYGSAAYRQDLSIARARAVAQALEARGLSKNRLQVVGYGSTRPAVNEFPGGRHDPAAAAANRRVVITITQGGCA